MMKSMKKLLSILTAGAMSVCSLSAINVLAANNAPRMYVNFTYEDENTARADIILQNMPVLTTAGFCVNFGEGWNPKLNSRGGIKHQWCDDIITADVAVKQVMQYEASNDVLVSFALGDDMDLNGTLVSIYLTKSSSANSGNLTGGIEFRNDEQGLSNTETNDQGIPDSYLANLTEKPVVLNSYEYIVGDTNGDNRITPVDASLVLSAVRSNPIMEVYEMRNNFDELFPNAVCAASPDANSNGFITRDDADEIIECYSCKGTETEYYGPAGKKDIFEFYDD